MADRTRFADDFRAAVSSLLDAGQKVTDLAGMYTAMGWGPGDFGFLTQDISAADLDAAITTCLSLGGTFAAAAVPLMKMRR